MHAKACMRKSSFIEQFCHCPLSACAVSLADAEAAEDPVENLLVGCLSYDFAQGFKTSLQICSDDFQGQILYET